MHETYQSKWTCFVGDWNRRILACHSLSIQIVMLVQWNSSHWQPNSTLNIWDDDKVVSICYATIIDMQFLPILRRLRETSPIITFLERAQETYYIGLNCLHSLWRGERKRMCFLCVTMPLSHSTTLANNHYKPFSPNSARGGFFGRTKRNLST